MKYLKLIIIVIALFGFLSTSCVKESNLDFEFVIDTIKIARIYQPDGMLGKDAIIESLSPDQNFGDAVFFTVYSIVKGTKVSTARALVQFELTDIPPQTNIKAAKLSFYWQSYNNLTEHAYENAFSIYRITQPWDDNTITWNNQPVIGSSFVAVPKSTSITQNYADIDVTTMVQHMVDYPSQNYGFMLKLDEEIPYRLVILASSDCLDGSKRPKLVVYF